MNSHTITSIIILLGAVVPVAAPSLLYDGDNDMILGACSKVQQTRSEGEKSPQGSPKRGTEGSAVRQGVSHSQDANAELMAMMPNISS